MARPEYLPVLLLVASVGLAAPAHAALPEAAKLMITNAARDGEAGDLEAVVKLARRSFPEDSAEIDTLVMSLQSPQELPVSATTSAQPAVVAAAVAVAEVAPPAPAAQAPATPPQPPKPVIKWSGRGDLGGFHTSGNTDSFGVTLGGNLTRKEESVTHQLRVRGDYQENAGKKSREFANAAWQGDWRINEKYYALGIVEYERDVLAGVNHRATASLGLGWRPIDKDGVRISIEAGPAFRHLWQTSGEEDSDLAGRGALNSSWQVNDNVKLSQDMELVTQQSNRTIRSITALQAKLTGRISSQFSYDVRYQDNPLLGKDNTDTISRVGIVYDF